MTKLPSSVRVGVIGLGRAFTLMLETFRLDPRVQLVAATDPLEAATAAFAKECAAPTYASAELLCQNANVELVYIASPHQFHAEHVAMAARHGKHVLLEKPMAISLAECSAMVQAMQQANKLFIVGHSHSFNAPVLHARKLIESGEIGMVQMIHAMNFTDFLYRARRPEELRTAEGGGVVHSQAAHQMDIVRLLGGGRVRSLRAHTQAWDATRATEGAYNALLQFEGGAVANLSYSGYGHFDSDALMGWRGELGTAKDPANYGAARQKLASMTTSQQELQAKADRNFGGSAFAPHAQSVAHQHFGQVIVCGTRGDLRLMPDGVWVHGDAAQRFDALPAPSVPRREVVDEVWQALRLGQRPAHNGAWAMATTEACLAMLESSRTQRDVALQHQVAWHAG
jgi:phthalate 4,5-cis-dihydrodiol dehydrogenase